MGYLDNMNQANATITAGRGGRPKKDKVKDTPRVLSASEQKAHREAWYKREKAEKATREAEAKKRKKVSAAAAIPTHGGYGEGGGSYGTWNAPAGTPRKQPAGAQEAAKRRTTTLDERREARMKYGMHKGKYLGPEAFKGDMRMLKAYRSQGSDVDPKTFAKDYKKVTGSGPSTGWHGRKGVGQGSGDKTRKPRSNAPDQPAYRGQWK